MKIGTRVKVIDPISIYSEIEGEIKVINEIDGKQYMQVEFKQEGDGNKNFTQRIWFLEEDLAV